MARFRGSVGAALVLAALSPGCGTLIAAGALDGHVRADGYRGPRTESVGEIEERTTITALEVDTLRVVCESSTRTALIRTTEAQPGWDVPLRVMGIVIAGMEGVLSWLLIESAIGANHVTGYFLPAAIFALDGAVALSLAIAMPESYPGETTERPGDWALTGSNCPARLSIELDGASIAIDGETGRVDPDHVATVAAELARYGTIVISSPGHLARIQLDRAASCEVARVHGVELAACAGGDASGVFRIPLGVVLRP